MPRTTSSTPLRSLLALTLVLSCPALADKVTQDPNAPGTGKPAAAVAKPDERLNQKITYEEGYKRLHEVVARLSADSKVRIYCGKNNNDWQARDLPVTVYVKDMPLGTLLQEIAEATHLAVTSTKVKGEVTYRIHRAGALQTDFDAYAEALAKMGREKSAWGWDALVKMKDVSDAKIAEWRAARPEWQSDRPLEMWREMGRVLDHVPKEDKEKALSGQRLIMSAASRPAALGSAIRKLAELLWKNEREKYASNPDLKPPDAPTAKMLDTVSIQLHTSPSRSLVEMDAGNIRVMESTKPNEYYLPGYWSQDLDFAATSLAKVSKTDLPSAPKDSLSDVRDGESIGEGFDWNLPFLRKKVDLDPPKEKTDPSFADLLLELHEKGSVNIVCEDFLSHTVTAEFNATRLFGKDQKIGRVLLPVHEIRWRADEENQMVIGKTAEWHRSQMNLVKESVYTNFCEKLVGDGVDLDDFLFTLWLTNGQYNAWFLRVRALEGVWISHISPDEGKPFWHLYDVLRPEHKAMAKSDQGFPLSECDPAWLAEALGEYRTVVAERNELAAIREPDEEPDIDPSTMPISSDPKVVATMRMYVCSQPSTDRTASTASGVVMPLRGKQYYLRITWREQGEDREFKSQPLDNVFPIRAPKKKAPATAGTSGGVK